MQERRQRRRIRSSELPALAVEPFALIFEQFGDDKSFRISDDDRSGERRRCCRRESRDNERQFASAHLRQLALNWRPTLRAAQN